MQNTFNVVAMTRAKRPKVERPSKLEVICTGLFALAGFASFGLLILWGIGVHIIGVYIWAGIFDTCLSAAVGFLFGQNISTKKERR